MAFYFSYQTFVSFATYDDLVQRDQRILESHEGLTQAEIDEYLKQASQRILTQIKSTDWWEEYCFKLDATLEYDRRNLPAVNPSHILGSEQSFKDLNIYFALQEYIYPSVADFGNPESADVAKIKFFKDQYDKLFTELIEDGSWYDFNGDNAIAKTEKLPNRQNRVRVR